MAVFSGPEIVNNGLVLHLDAANSKSKSYNVILHPENLTSLLGLRAGAVITSDSTAAPDGTQTADLITGTGSGFGYYFPAFPVGNATHSFFVKPNGSTNSFSLYHAGTGMSGTFTFSTKTFSSMVSYTGSYEALSNGWYLVNFHTTAEINLYYIELGFDSNNGGYIWGVQLTPFLSYREYVPKSAGKLQFTDNTVWKNLNGSVDATLVNGVGYSGVNNGTMVFDGVDDYATIPSNPAWAVGANATMENWLYFDRTGAITNHRIWCISNNSTSLDIGITVGSTKLFTAGSVGYPSTVATLPVQTWVHTAVVFDGGNILIYFNGINQALDGTTTGVNKTNTGTLFLGQFSGGGGYTFEGKISTYRLYNRALTPLEIQQNFNAIRSRYGL